MHAAAQEGGSEQATQAPVDVTPPLVTDPGLYDPSGHALRHFHEALAQLERGSKALVRVAFFGASHVASDLFTDIVRDRLQARFGDAGPGFVLAGKPNPWHRHGRAVYEKPRGFHRAQVFARSPKSGRYGLAGVALDSDPKRYGRTAMQTRTPEALAGGVSHVELYYLKQPGGGRVRVLVDGKGLSTLRTDSRSQSYAAGYQRFDVPSAEHHVELRTQPDGPVRLFGLVLENDRPGVVVDTLGVPGARIRNQLYWDEALFTEHLKRRQPDLVVLAYGTNEAGDDDVPLEAYEARMRQAIQRIRAALPEASCLLVGPTDRPIRDRETNELSDRPRTAQLVESQKRISAEEGCAFFDLYALMGGSLSMGRWVQAEPALGAPDHVHLTARGYEAVGELLHDNLMRGYVRPEPSAPQPETQPAPAEGVAASKLQ